MTHVSSWAFIALHSFTLLHLHNLQLPRLPFPDLNLQQLLLQATPPPLLITPVVSTNYQQILPHSVSITSHTQQVLASQPLQHYPSPTAQPHQPDLFLSLIRISHLITNRYSSARDLHGRDRALNHRPTPTSNYSSTSLRANISCRSPGQLKDLCSYLSAH